MRQLLKLKNKNPHTSCVIYQGSCVYNEMYIGTRNTRVRWDEHEDPQKESETVKHLRNHPGRSFSWKTLFVSAVNRARKSCQRQ